MVLDVLVFPIESRYREAHASVHSSHIQSWRELQKKEWLRPWVHNLSARRHVTCSSVLRCVWLIRARASPGCWAGTRLHLFLQFVGALPRSSLLPPTCSSPVTPSRCILNFGCR